MIKFREVTELLLLVALIFACHASKKNSSQVLPAFDIEGHRGCRGLMPENTIPAMMKALELGVTTLEMDAVITKDKQVILSHEPFFNHDITTGPDGKYVTEQDERSLNIYKMTYAQTQTYDVGLKPHPRYPNQRRLKATKPVLKEESHDPQLPRLRQQRHQGNPELRPAASRQSSVGAARRIRATGEASAVFLRRLRPCPAVGLLPE